jgi:hypothetical protein
MAEIIFIVCHLNSDDPRDGLPLCEQVLNDFARFATEGPIDGRNTTATSKAGFVRAYTRPVADPSFEKMPPLSNARN